MDRKARRIEILHGSRIEIMNNWAKIGLGLGALYIAFRVAVKELVVGVQKVTLRALDVVNGTAAVQLNVSVRNPLPFGVKVQNITGDVYAGGVQVGTVNTRFDYLCGGERTHILPVIVNLTAEGLGNALWNNIQTGNIHNLVIDFNGQLHVTRLNIAVPIELSIKWEDLVG